jgi:hypothetical protein
VLEGEKIFAGLDKELSEDVFAITYRRNNRETWEPEFVSVIDARGAKALRAYFTKWHELAHLLTLTDQLRLSFRRTHIAKDFNSPEEALMELIAGHFGFYGPMIKPHISGAISFDAIETLRQKALPGSKPTIRSDRRRESMAAAVLIDKRPACQEKRRCSAKGSLWEQGFSGFVTGGSRDGE